MSDEVASADQFAQAGAQIDALLGLPSDLRPWRTVVIGRLQAPTLGPRAQAFLGRHLGSEPFWWRVLAAVQLAGVIDRASRSQANLAAAGVRLREAGMEVPCWASWPCPPVSVEVREAISPSGIVLKLSTMDDTWETQVRDRITRPEFWTLPTLVAGWAHRLEITADGALDFPEEGAHA